MITLKTQLNSTEVASREVLTSEHKLRDWQHTRKFQLSGGTHIGYSLRRKV